jgi:hypothetical protein
VPVSDYVPIAKRLPVRERCALNRLPTTIVINMASEAKGGTRHDILSGPGDDEIEIEIDNKEQLMQAVVALIDLELETESAEMRTEFIGAALTEPIDDPEAKDPKTICKVQLLVYWSYWLVVLYEELKSLKAKGVYIEVNEIPPGQKPVDLKWVLNIKWDGQVLISHFKAHLVAKGFTQIPGQDFTYTFAPVAHWESIQILLAVVASYDWELRQIDVKTAFLNGPLEEEIYMKKPDILGLGFWCLLKGLYSLKQSGRTWYLELNEKLQTIGLKQLESDRSVHIQC